ncbi:MAG: hypothetical protein WC477_06425 [Patescibacteria group bacterium]
MVHEIPVLSALTQGAHILNQIDALFTGIGMSCSDDPFPEIINGTSHKECRLVERAVSRKKYELVWGLTIYIPDDVTENGVHETSTLNKAISFVDMDEDGLDCIHTFVSLYRYSSDASEDSTETGIIVLDADCVSPDQIWNCHPNTGQIDPSELLLLPDEQLAEQDLVRLFTSEMNVPHSQNMIEKFRALAQFVLLQ